MIVNNQQDFVYNAGKGATDEASRLTFDQSWERRVEAEPTEGEARIERESSAGSGLRLIQPPQLCQCSGKIEMREGQIALGIDAPAQPYDRFRVSTEKRLGATQKHHPPKRVDIVWREAERLVDMGLGFRGTTKQILGKTDASIRAGQISIQRQRLLALSNALRRPVRNNLSNAEERVSRGVSWGQGQSLDQGCLGRREARGPVVGEKTGGN